MQEPLTSAQNKKLYQRYCSMIARCYDINHCAYKYYGAKGIKVDFNNYKEYKTWALANGYSPELQIDRIDSKKNYSPANCRWVTQQENEKNKDIYKVEYAGQTNCLKDWCKILGLSYGTILRRLKINKMTIEEAFETPIGSLGRNY